MRPILRPLLPVLLAMPLAAGAQFWFPCDTIRPFDGTRLETGDSTVVDPWQILQYGYEDVPKNQIRYLEFPGTFEERMTPTPSVVRPTLPGTVEFYRWLVRGDWPLACVSVPKVQVAGNEPVPPAPTPVADQSHIPDGGIASTGEHMVVIAKDGSFTGAWPLRAYNFGTGDLHIHRIVQPIETNRVKISIIGPDRDLVIAPGEQRLIWLKVEVTDMEQLLANPIIRVPFLAFTDDAVPSPLYPANPSWLSSAGLDFVYPQTATDIGSWMIPPLNVPGENWVIR